MSGGQGGRLVRIPEVAPHSKQAEQALLGAILLAGSAYLQRLSSELRLRPEHFYTAGHGRIFRAMLALEQAGEAVDEITVGAQLEKTGGGHLRSELDGLAGVVPDLGNVASYAANVIELAIWRGRIDAAVSMLEASASMDDEVFRRAEHGLASAESPGSEAVASPEALGERFFDWLSDSNADRRVIETPFARLNEMLVGGLRPGATSVLAGWTSMGKSTVGDQILEHARGGGYSACAYINEDSVEERVARTLAGRTGVPFERILNPQRMSPSQWKRVVDGLPSLPFAIQPAAGMDAEDIARHVRRHRWGIFMVDLATLLPASTTQEWANISKTLTSAARESGSHGLIVVQLNQTRNDLAERRPPALRDLKWTGAWADDAANVIFVHRSDVEVSPGIFEPGADGHLRLAKAKNGRPGMVGVSLDPFRMRFTDDYQAPREEQFA